MIRDFGFNVLIFDDNYSEVEPLINGLIEERVPHYFINFKTNKIKDKPFKNIRLIFADLILGDNISGDLEKNVEPIRKSIVTNIEEDNGPIIIVGWSKHNENLLTLVERINKSMPNIICFPIQLEKTDFIELKDQDNYALIEGKSHIDILNVINEKLDELDYLKLFLQWEKDQRYSIAKTLNSFISKDEKDRISGILGASLGKSVKIMSRDEKTYAFYETLNTILDDENDHINQGADVFELFDRITESDIKNINETLKYELNTKFMLSNNSSQTLIYPGNVFKIDEKYFDKFKEFEHGCSKIKFDKLLRGEVLIPCKDYEGIGKKTDAYKDLLSKIQPIALEYTAFCDFAQAKTKKIKLVLGYVFPSEYEDYLLSRTDYLYMTSNFNLNGNIVKLVLNFLHTVSFQGTILNDLDLLFRVRKEVLNHIQHRLAHYISRPGINILS